MITKGIKSYRPPLKKKTGKSAFINLISAKKLVENGLPAEFFDQLTQNLNISAKALCEIVAINVRTLNRRKTEGKFNREESDRIMRIHLLLQFAKKVLGDNQEASSWLKTPQLALNGQIPLELAETEIGSREVEMLLGQIHHGIFS